MILSPFVAFFVATIAMLLPLAWYVRKNYAPNRGLGIDFSNPLYIFSLLYFLSFIFFYLALYVVDSARFLKEPFSVINDTFVLFLSVAVYWFILLGFIIAEKYDVFKACYITTENSGIESFFSIPVLLTALAIVTSLKIIAYCVYFSFSNSLPTGQLSFFYGKGYIVFLFSFFVWFVIVLLISKMFLRHNSKKTATLAIILIVINMFIFNFLDGSRRYFIMPIMLFAILLYMQGKIKNKHILGAGIFLFFVLIILRIEQHFVYDLFFGEVARTLTLSNLAGYIYVFATSFDSFYHTSNTIFKYSLSQHPLGVVGFQSLIDIFASYIPRALWPSKPDIYGDMLFQNLVYPGLYAQLGFNCSRFPLGFVGYATLSFGIVGLILFPLLTGMFYGFLNKFKLASTLSLALFLWFFGEAFNIVRSGFILGLLQQLVGIALSIAILYAVFICLKACNIIYKTVFTKNG